MRLDGETDKELACSALLCDPTLEPSIEVRTEISLEVPILAVAVAVALLAEGAKVRR